MENAGRMTHASILASIRDSRTNARNPVKTDGVITTGQWNDLCDGDLQEVCSHRRRSILLNDLSIHDTQVSEPIKLTKREIEVLTLVIEGKSSKEVADMLYVSKRTVDFHLANIYDKLQVSNRVQAFRRAARLGLIPFDAMSNNG
jgi:DNA-binding CsgD family transcriptional regulator